MSVSLLAMPSLQYIKENAIEIKYKNNKVKKKKRWMGTDTTLLNTLNFRAFADFLLTNKPWLVWLSGLNASL